MLPGDRLVCAFVQPQRVGLQFRAWLLHVTIVPWFRHSDSSDGIAGGFERALQRVAPFEAVGEGEAHFGPRKNRPVRILRPSEPLTDVEAKVRGYLHKKRAWLVDETTKVQQNFRPHVTAQGSEGLREGEAFRCDRLYIVEQKGDYKEIVSEIVLHG